MSGRWWQGRLRPWTRREAIAGMLACAELIAATHGLAAAGPRSRAPAGDGEALGVARRRLAQTRAWGCQYQNVDIQALAQSDLELIVIDPLLDGGTWQPITADEIALLKRRPDGGRRLVLAYLSVGEASSARPYWDDRWRSDPPAWLGAANPEWPGAYAVRHWHAAWREILLCDEPSALGGIASAGYDGVFLDRVDGYVAWQSTDPATADTMVALVAEIATAARKVAPGFLLMSQNAEMLLERSDFREHIDAVSKESLLFGLAGPQVRNTADDVAWSRTRLEIARASGLPIFAIEYLSEPALIEEAHQALTAWDYRAFFGDRLLDRQPTVRHK